MRQIQHVLLVVLATVLTGPLMATTYYVSPTGNDANNGTSQATPWRTVDRANQILALNSPISPGDQILFQRGGQFRGQIDCYSSGSASASLIIGAYGTGNAPIIDGSVQVTTWTPYQGNIWRAYVGQKIDQLYVNGSRVTRSRAPNSGWYRNDLNVGNTVQSADLTQPHDYWTGSRIVMRYTMSSVDTIPVTGYSNGTLTLSQAPYYGSMGTEDWGFYLENKLELVDVPNEWYYDATSGYVFLQAPNNADPNGLLVEGTALGMGIWFHGYNHYVTIQDLAFHHYRRAGAWLDLTDHVVINGCSFVDVYMGIRSYSHDNRYTNNTFLRTMATGCTLIDDNSLFENNTMTDIAVLMGEGETGFGYVGVGAPGQNNIIRGNSIDRVGYCGIAASRGGIVEKNTVRHCLSLLNDGGAITFDNTDGLVVQDNIIYEPICSLDGAATENPNYKRMGVGVYFGNIVNTNVVVQRNTIADMPMGILVDHTMVAHGIQVKDNTIFNCEVGIQISDYSNYNGPNATPPYHVSNFDDVYSGNVVYGLTKDQISLRFTYCYGVDPTDFGTFTNNRYFNPYNEIGIVEFNVQSGTSYWTLEHWQQHSAKEAGTTRSPLRLSEFATVSELSGNLIPSGDFTSNVTGWSGFPYNAQVTQNTSFLDNGCLKAYLPDNSQYDRFYLRNPNWFPVTNGASDWYRLDLSLQSNAEGDLLVDIKGESQSNNPYALYERKIPFSAERRDLSIYFQSPNAEQAQLMLVNNYTEPMYYLDNVQLHKVQVQALDPLDAHKLFINEQSTAQNFSLIGCWSDVNGNVMSGSITVQPYSGLVLYKVADTHCTAQGSTGTLGARVFLGGALNWSTYLMRDDLRAANLIPMMEPYTAMGYTLENPSATVSSSLLAITGNTAIVDWVVLEVRNTDATYSAAASKACLVRRDGTVVTTTGDPVITFNTASTVGKVLVIRHRNHLAAMTATAINSNGQMLDLTVPSTVTYGIEAQQTNGLRNCLWAGNCDPDGMVRYAGVSNDRDPILTIVGGSVPTATYSGYRHEDVNMDGVVKYTGVNNDRDAVLTIVGGTVPTNTKAEQLP